MNSDEYSKLEKSIEEMMVIARGFGLDFFDMRFELVPADVLYTFGAYQGMPTRFSHWSFGKAYHRMKLDYDLGLSRIYELVINSDPSYAFLLDSNSLVQNKLVSAHVLGHSDFFKNNATFRRTSRNIVDSMAASAERFRSYETQYGKEVVENFLDSVLALQEHVDPQKEDAVRRRLGRNERPDSEQKVRGKYDDLFDLDRLMGGQGSPPAGARQSAVRQGELEKDLLLFLVMNSKTLTDWQRDIVSVIREEMLYFWPQIETKIMNEGWPSVSKDAWIFIKESYERYIAITLVFKYDVQVRYIKRGGHTRDQQT